MRRVGEPEIVTVDLAIVAQPAKRGFSLPTLLDSRLRILRVELDLEQPAAGSAYGDLGV